MISSKFTYLENLYVYGSSSNQVQKSMEDFLYKAFNPINNHNPGSEKNTEFYDLQLSKIQVLFLDAIGFQVGSYMVSM